MDQQRASVGAIFDQAVDSSDKETAAAVSPAILAARSNQKRWLLWLIPLTGAAALLLLLPVLGLVGYGAYHFLANKQQARNEQLARAEEHEKEEADPQTLARHASEILHTNCYRCHGQDGVMEGGFNYLMDRQRLVDRHKIVPGQPEQSKLLSRIRDGEMPPEGEKQRPSSDEIAVLRRWVEAGAPAFTSGTPRQTMPPVSLPKLIHDDLAQLPERDRRFARHFTLTHLRTAGLTEDELQTHRQALSKLVNSLSWGREIVPPRAVDADKTLMRIDLRDYKWDGATWERILAEYSYGSVTDDETSRELAAAADCRLPYIRADWFTSVASRPPLYFELLKLPATDRELEALLHVDAAQDIQSERVVRAGFNDSGVSRNNRIIERHESSYGAYWKSYDFAGGAGAKNIFACPLGPGGDANSFQPDGGEMIFELPNGLHGYFLVDGGGKRMDQAPTAVVSDPKRPERAVVNGLSCMSCHSRGFNDKADQVREQVRKNPGAFPQKEADTVLALYPPRDRFEALLRGDNDRYRRALEKTGTRWGASDPIETLAARFEGDVDLSLAAAEVGVSSRELEDAISGSPMLGRTLGALRSGGTASRKLFADSFGDLLRRLRLGESLRPNGPKLPPALKERVVAELPEPFADVRIGGGGRLLIFYLKKAKKLAIFDILQAKIVHEIDIPAEDVRFGAGRDKLLMVLPGEKVIQRWDLHTFQREKTVPVPGGIGVTRVLMGYDSQGPLVLWAGANRAVLLDVERMEPMEIDCGRLTGEAKWGFDIRISANGRNFVTWHNGISPGGFGITHLTGKTLTGTSLDGAGFNGNWVQPNPDGSLFMRNDAQVFSGALKKYPADWLRGWILIPSDDPRFFLGASGLNVSVCTTADRRPVFTVNDKALQGMWSSSSPTGWYHFNSEPRLHYLPEARLLAFLPMDNKTIVVRPFDLIGELEQEGKDYLFVQSQPKTHVKAGGVYQYQMDVKSKAAGVTYKLEKGPDGMTVSSGGEVRWNVPASQADKATPVIISVRNATGKELFHTFEILAD